MNDQKVRSLHWESLKELMAIQGILKPQELMEMLSKRESDDLKAIKDILPFIESTISKMDSHEEIKPMFQVILKLVDKDQEWALNVAKTSFFTQIKKTLATYQNHCDNETFENLCLVVNAACFKNPFVKQKISELDMEQCIYDFLKDEENKVYQYSTYLQWKLPALKVLNNVQSWKQNFIYSDDYVKSLLNLTMSLTCNQNLLVDDPIMAAAVLLNIFKLMLTSASLASHHANSIAYMMTVILKLDKSSTAAVDCIQCLNLMAKQRSLMQAVDSDDMRLLLASLLDLCQNDAKLFVLYLSNVSAILECNKKSKNKSQLVSFQTVGQILLFASNFDRSRELLKEVHKLIIVMAKNEYLVLLQSNEDRIFEFLEAGIKSESDTLVLMDLYQSLSYIAKLSMTCNERVTSIVFPQVIDQVKNKWQDRIMTLRSLELISTVMVSADHSMLIFEGVLIVLAKCLEVWRFDMVIAEVIMTMLTTFNIYQWDIKDEINKLNFVHLVKAIEVSSEAKFSDELPRMCTRFLKAVAEYHEPLHASNIKALELKDEVLVLPPDIDMFLSQGEILSVYTVDGRVKRMHVQTVQSHTRIVCKCVNSIVAKDKYMMQIGCLKKITKGYEKSGDSVFEKSTSFFSRYPNPNMCFSLYSLTVENGPSEFHFCCKDKDTRDKWIDYFSTLLKFRKSAYKKGLELKAR